MVKYIDDSSPFPCFTPQIFVDRQYVIGTGLGPPESPMNKTEAFFMEFTASKDDQHKYNYSQV